MNMSPKALKATLKSSAVITEAAATVASKQAFIKMHRRSRTGCFTCRLRRKKCDEGKSSCKACKHLGLACEYKRPSWWSNNEQRKKQKEAIKDVIKNTKHVEKQPVSANLSSANTPPSLCFSLPTSDSHCESAARTQGASPDSQLSPPFGYDIAQDYFNSTPMPPPGWTPITQGYPHFSPFEVDVKTERQTYINDVPTRIDSTISTFSTFHPPPTPHGPLNNVPANTWIHQEFFESQSETFAEEPLDLNFFNFPYDQVTPSHQGVIQVDECDRELLNHFFNKVLPLVFPVLEANQHGSAQTSVILPALEHNRCYLHCCLSASALHLKATKHMQSDQIDNDIMRHRGATISTLCEALSEDANHPQMLEATLAMIFFQSAVGSPDDGLPDIPWHQHFQAAADLVARLDLPQQLLDLGKYSHAQPPFNMTLAAWMDILGATMLGRVPLFADTYRQKNVSNTSSGLAELMGCEDRIMYLISEIACLEALKNEGMDDLSVCNIISQLGEHLSKFDPGTSELAPVFVNGSAALRPRQLSKNMTAVFRLAARIYLCALVPDFDRHNSSIVNLVEALVHAMQYIPDGPDGFDRSLVWPLLIAGSVSLKNSSFRTMFQERTVKLEDAAKFGSFGRIAELLQDVWAINDEASANGEKKSVHWRDVMQFKGWDFLLI